MSTEKANRYTLVSLFLVLIIDVMGIGLIFPVLGPLFMSGAGGILAPDTTQASRNALYGIVMAIFSLFMLIGAPLLGDLSDSWGRKKVLLICLFGTCLSYLISALGIYFTNVGLLIVGRIVGGLLAGSQPIAQAAIADISTLENKAANISMIALAGCIGFVIGPIIGGYFSDNSIASWFTFYTPFLFAALLALINAGALMFTFKETYRPIVKKSLTLTKGIQIFVDAFTHKNIRCLSLTLFLSETGWSLYFQVTPLVLVNTYHFTAEKIGLFMAAIGLAFGVALRFIIRRLLEVFDLRTVTLIGLALTTAGILGAALFQNELAQWICVVPINLGLALPYAALITMMSNSVDKNSQGWVMGVSGAVIAMAWLISGLAAGVLGIFGNTLPFVVASILTLSSLVIMFFYRETITSSPVTDDIKSAQKTISY